MTAPESMVTRENVQAGFRLTGFFLERDVFAARGLAALGQHVAGQKLGHGHGFGLATIGADQLVGLVPGDMPDAGDGTNMVVIDVGHATLLIL